MSGLPDAVVDEWSWPDGITFTASSDGLINQTFVGRADDRLVGVIQRVNTDVFGPEVHEDIQAVTEHLERKGLITPHLVPTRDGALWATTPFGVYRRLTPVGERTILRLSNTDQARSAGAIVGRFHEALADFEWPFRSVRPGAHDTPLHMKRLQDAIDAHSGHRLYDRVAPVAHDILEHHASWTGHLVQPSRVIHGDLKVSNLRWEGDVAMSVIDLDTMQVGSLAVELGDALRSWCNPLSEDDPGAHFDLALFESAMAGYLSTSQPPLAELDAIVRGVDRIATELASRFARDALEESYFGWDERFGTRGEHNLCRAAGQLALARSVRAQMHQAQQAIRGLSARA